MTGAVLFAVLLLSGCDGSRYPGFKACEGVYYRLLSFGEGDRACQAGDYATLSMACLTMNDSLYATSFRTFRIGVPSSPSAFDHCFSLLNEGDSAIFIVPTGEFYQHILQKPIPSFMQHSSMMKVAMRLQLVQNPAEYAQLLPLLKQGMLSVGQPEMVQLAHYLRHAKIKTQPLPSGIFYVPLREAAGSVVRSGQSLIIEYEGFFLDGRKFDSTRDRGEPFQFVVGQQQQLIDGLEIVVSRMHLGEKGVAVIPSHAAFGRNGSSTGIVPPQTTVVYEVEVTAAADDSGIPTHP